MMSDLDYKLFTTIAKMSQTSLYKSMRTHLKRYYAPEKMKIYPEYIMCEGDIPVMLVAHMDTVFKTPPQSIYYDKEKAVMWSPDGLGADDRAGVYAILKILQKGYRPYVCLTIDEEVGGLGATAVTKDYRECPYDLKYIIQLDRQGYCDCVFYDCDNEDFTNYIMDFGFSHEWGTFSDISIICPNWKVAGVNLSVGYKNEHNVIETLNTNALYATIKKVCKMLDAANEAPKFEYIDGYYGYRNYFGANFWSDWYKFDGVSEVCQCEQCKKYYPEDDVFLVKSKKYKNLSKYYCIDCVAKGVNWCKQCGQAFETDDDKEDFCPTCRNADLPNYSYKEEVNNEG